MRHEPEVYTCCVWYPATDMNREMVGAYDRVASKCFLLLLSHLAISVKASCQPSPLPLHVISAALSGSPLRTNSSDATAQSPIFRGDVSVVNAISRTEISLVNEGCTAHVVGLATVGKCNGVAWRSF